MQYTASPELADARVETTTIEGLHLHHTKVVGDARGILAELISNGAKNPVLAPGFGNMYTSIAVGKHTGRAAHSHTQLRELFFTLSGCALWYFYDLRKDSPTSGKSYACVLGFDRPPAPAPDPVYVLADRDMVRMDVPPGVYHAYWPLTDTPVVVVAVPSLSHDDADYLRLSPKDVPGCAAHVARYGIAA